MMLKVMMGIQGLFCLALCGSGKESLSFAPVSVEGRHEIKSNESVIIDLDDNKNPVSGIELGQASSIVIVHNGNTPLDPKRVKAFSELVTKRNALRKKDDESGSKNDDENGAKKADVRSEKSRDVGITHIKIEPRNRYVYVVEKGVSVVPGHEIVFGKNNFEQIVGVVAECPHIYALDVSHNHLDSDMVQALANKMNKMSTLKVLDISHNDLGVEGAKILARGLSHINGPHLERFTISFNNIQSLGFRSFMIPGERDQMPLKSSLMLLDLSGNNISDRDKDFELAAKSMYRLDALEVLHISTNDITWAGIQALFGSLAVKKGGAVSFTLRELYAKNNKIGNDGLAAIARGMKRMDLAVLDLENNRIGNDGIFDFQDAPKTHLTTLNLSRNEIDDTGAEGLAVVLSDMKKLKELYISNNEIGDQGADALAKNVKDVPLLTWLDISKNKLTEKGKQTLMNIARVHPKKPRVIV